MKDIIKHFVIGLVIGLIASGLMVWGYNVGKRHSTNTVDTIIDTIQINDTITQWQPYDVHHYRTDTAYLPVIDTILDTVTDSVFVEVPVSMYRYDTTIVDSNYETSLKAVVSGYSVSLDTLSIHTEITKQEAILVPKQRRWGVGAGLMYGTGGIGIGVGIFYKLF